MAHPSRQLSVERIREVLAAWPPPSPVTAVGDLPTEPDVALVADYHRIIAIHQQADQGGISEARAGLVEQLHAEAPAEAVAEQLPAGDAFGTRRIAALREDRLETTRATIRRLDTIVPDEEAAVAACRAEIEAALDRLR